MLWNNHLSEEQKKALFNAIMEDDESELNDDDSGSDKTEEK